MNGPTNAASIARQKWAEPAAAKIPGNGGTIHRAAQSATIVSVVVIGVVSIVGLLVFAQVEDAIPSLTNTELEGTSAEVVGGFASAMELIPIVMLVLVAAVVIAVVQRMRQGNGGM